MITLYFNRFTRATRPRWLMEEAGIPYELHTLDLRQGEHKSPEYLKINPLGRLPALKDDDTILTESLAIILYLADKYADRGLGPTPSEAAAYYTWAVYGQVTLEPEVNSFFRYGTDFFKTPDPEKAAAAKAAFNTVAAPLEAQLTGKTFVCGERFTAADVVVGAIVTWAGSIGLLEGFPALSTYAAHIKTRPAFLKART